MKSAKCRYQIPNYLNIITCYNFINPNLHTPFLESSEVYNSGHAMPSSPQRSPFGERKSYSSFDRRTPSRYSRQESSNSTTSSDGEDFRSLAKRMSRTAGSSTQLLDPTARLAAQKKAEAEEKLKLQKQIEEMKTKMNTVETVERTPFSYDPTKVVSQFESEMQEVEVFVEEAPDEETQEYKEWLETVMARGWNEEVKELVSGRKKVSKRNLIRARKRSIVKRYSIIVPELSEEYCLPLEEDEFTEEEKLRLEIEKHFSDIDMDEDIEEISRNRHWSAEIQELVVSKKKINHHNLRNARKRNIVKRLYEKYPGSVYDLCLGPDEFTECEIERQKLHNEIARISVLIEGSDDMESLINHVAEHWGFDSEAIENDKKKTNKKNIFNYLVRSLIGKSQDVFPELEYSIDLEEDEFTEEEQKRRDYEKKLDLINGDFGDKSCDEIAETNEEIILQLQDKNWLVSKENITRLLKRNALAEVYGEDDELMMGQHEVTDGLFDLSDRGHALELIDEKMMSVDEKLNSNDDLGINFPKEVAELNAIHAVLNAENVRLVCLNDALEEALEKYPDSDMELPNSDFELTELGLASKELSEEFGELESLLTAAPDEEFLSDNNWENERSYLRDNNIKENARNIVLRRKQKLYDDYKECYPNNELEEQFVYDEFTAEEIEASKLRENNELYQKVCQAIEQELEGAKISLDRAYKRSGIDHDNLEDHLDEFEWKNEVTQLIKVGIPIKRKPLFELKSRNIISMYQSKYKDFQLGHYLSDPHGYDSDSDTEYSGETGCLTCDIKAKTAFFPSSPSEENYVLDHQVSIEAFADQIIAFPVDSDTDASIPPSPAGNVTSDPLPRYFPPLPEELDDGVAYDVKSIQSLNDANLRPDLFLPESLHLNNINEVECDGPEVQTPTLGRELSGHNSPPSFYADEVHNNGSESPKCNGSHSSLQRDNHAVADPLEREAIASVPQESNVKTSQSRRQSDKSTTETDRLGSIGSDSVFESLSTKTSPISIELTAADSSEDVVLSEANEVSTDDDGDNEFSATDENGLSRKTPTDTARKYDLPGKTATQIQKDSLISSGSSEEIAQLSQTKTNRVPKRKKTSGSGSSVENHSLSKDSSRKPNSLEPRRSLDSKKSHNNSLENDVPCSLLQLPDVNDTKKGQEMPNFDHIKSNYRMEKHNPLIDRKKYIKVPTLEDNIVTSQPLLEGLLPKEFYEQKLSYDLEGTVVDPKQTRPKKNRSKSDIALPATAPTTGHLYWNLMKERKLEREEEGTMITDLDLAVCLQIYHFMHVS